MAASEQFKVASFDLTIFSAGVFLLYSRQRSYGNSKTSHVRTYSPQNKYYVKQNQKMGSPVNKSAHRPESSVQSPAFKTSVQRPGITVCPQYIHCIIFLDFP